jgi:site-specific recombinase XerD
MCSSRQPGQPREAAPREAAAAALGGTVSLTTSAGASDAVTRLIKRVGERARFAFPVHAHMLRHACGCALANAGPDTRAIQDWLGHRSIHHTAGYTELSPTRFRHFWRD